MPNKVGEFVLGHWSLHTPFCLCPSGFHLMDSQCCALSSFEEQWWYLERMTVGEERRECTLPLSGSKSLWCKQISKERSVTKYYVLGIYNILSRPVLEGGHHSFPLNSPIGSCQFGIWPVAISWSIYYPGSCSQQSARELQKNVRTEYRSETSWYNPVRKHIALLILFKIFNIK